MRPAVVRLQSDPGHPLIDEASMLPGADMIGVIDPGREREISSAKKEKGILQRKKGTVQAPRGLDACQDASVIRASALGATGARDCPGRSAVNSTT